jgi:threonylcarbamoyladenosine tRNA methylthiotransferase MtaB
MAILKAAFHTLGCKTNHYETDAIRTLFIRAGFMEVPFNGTADVYVVNTCAVTGEADRKSCQMLRRARRNNANAIVVAIGCHVELSQTSGFADILVGTYGKNRVLDLVLKELARRGWSDCAPTDARTGTIQLQNDPARYEELGLADIQSETRAVIKIEDGCSNSCAYCTIPLARGPVRSRSKDMILREASALAAAGFREIVLTGIHICSYGADYGLPSHAVMELAMELARISGIDRIRLGSLEPESVTPVFIELARKNPKLQPHFHISLQSGSDAVLGRMGRKYRTPEFRDTVKNLRDAFQSPDGHRNASPGLTTDVMVGFPGETDAEHRESLDFCHEIGFSRMHVFRYSRRPGTAAAGMPGQVDPGIAGKRADEMLELAGQMAFDFHRAQIGRMQMVLLENQEPDGFFAGYSPEYAPVRVLPGSGFKSGMVAEVKTVSANRDFLVCHGANIEEP